MRRIALLVVVSSGCFYTDSITQRPSIEIVQTSSATVYRGDAVELDATADDPQGEAVYFKWRVYACTDATEPNGCDVVPAFTGFLATETFIVPPMRVDQPVAVQSLLVDLEGTDALGATAKPIQTLVIPVADHPPDLDLRKVSRYGYVVGVPIDLYAKVGDIDDGVAAVQPLDWTVFSPATQPAFTLDDLTVTQDPNDPAHEQFGKTFTPMGIGDWDVQVTATDQLGASTMSDLPITVVADHAPCLETWEPIAAPPGQSLPISDPTLFQIEVVADDLDPYPPVPSDPVLGVTTFTWSLLPAGATTREVLAGVTGNRVPIDPASYNPGDIIELRVEIQDRNHTPITCADSDPTCSVISDPTCIQRLTWNVEVE